MAGRRVQDRTCACPDIHHHGVTVVVSVALDHRQNFLAKLLKNLLLVGFKVSLRILGFTLIGLSLSRDARKDLAWYSCPSVTVLQTF